MFLYIDQAIDSGSRILIGFPFRIYRLKMEDVSLSIIRV